MSTHFKGWVAGLLLLLVGTQAALAERTTTYLHTDGLGSVVAASDQSGAVLWRKSYTPFGEQIDTQPDNERLSYTGKSHDDAIGLTYFGGRYYDPNIGRFASVDPVGFVESNPMSFNRYLYVNNNPYKYVDPDGEFLNFAAKFVLDVGVNVAFNYITTGEMDVGGALKESAVGILNPAKTVAKAGKLAKVLLKAEKKMPPPKRTLYHYTDADGAKGIAESGVIRANERGQAFVTDQKLSPDEVKNRIFLGRSGDKGSHVVEIEPVEGLPIRPGKNANEFIHQGSIRDGRHGTFTVKKNEL